MQSLLLQGLRLSSAWQLVALQSVCRCIFVCVSASVWFPPFSSPFFSSSSHRAFSFCFSLWLLPLQCVWSSGWKRLGVYLEAFIEESWWWRRVLSPNSRKVPRQTMSFPCLILSVSDVTIVTFRGNICGFFFLLCANRRKHLVLVSCGNTFPHVPAGGSSLSPSALTGFIFITL